MTNWIEFEGRRSAADVAEPRVTVQKGGTIGLNLAAYRLLGEPTHVTYLSDGSGQRFAIKAATAETPNCYPVRAQVSARSYVIGSKLFLRWAGIPFGDHPRYYSMRMEDGVGVVEATPETKKASKSAGRGKS